MSMPRSVPTMENLPVGEGDVGRRGLQHLGGRLLAFVDHGVGGQQDGLAFGIEAA